MKASSTSSRKMIAPFGSIFAWENTLPKLRSLSPIHVVMIDSSGTYSKGTPCQVMLHAHSKFVQIEVHTQIKRFFFFFFPFIGKLHLHKQPMGNRSWTHSLTCQLELIKGRVANWTKFISKRKNYVIHHHHQLLLLLLFLCA